MKQTRCLILVQFCTPELLYFAISIFIKRSRMRNIFGTVASVLQADTTMAMDTDSNADEEGADESRDGPSPGRTLEEVALSCAPVQAISAPCSPTGTRPAPGPGSSLDCASVQKAGERPSSLPPSSPRALTNNDWAYHSTVCPVERQNPGMHKDKGIICMLPYFTNRYERGMGGGLIDMVVNGGDVIVNV